MPPQSSSSLFRASFNFTSKCNLSCRFCYIPFSDHNFNVGIATQVVERLSAIGVQSITFGGGDPLKYDSILSLLKHARKIGIPHLHVDTNALGWAAKELLAQVADIVDVVGLPLDGPSPDIHAAMRSHRRSWSDSVSAALFLRSRTTVKINTVVGAPNLQYLPQLSSLIDHISPKIWSLYEFWPVGTIAQNNESMFFLQDGEFKHLTNKVMFPLEKKGINIEYGSIDERSPSYFFVTDEGCVYTIDPDDRTKYLDLGSVFDDEILERWGNNANMKHNFDRTKRRFQMD